MQVAEASGPRPAGSRRKWQAGVATGVVGAFAMMAFMVATSTIGEGAPLDPVRVVGTSFRGADASLEGAFPIVWGVIVQVVLGGAFGVLLTTVPPKGISAPAGAVLGAGSALIAMAIAMTLVISPRLHDLMSLHGGAWVIAIALFGAIAGLGPWLRRRIAERPAPGSRSGAPVLRPRPTSG